MTHFGLWSVNAIAAAVLAAVVLWVAATEPFLAPILLAFFVAYAVAAIIVALVVVPLLRRRVNAIATSLRPRLVLFGAMAASWVAAWILGVFTFGLVNLAYAAVEAATPGLSTDANQGFGLFAGYWTWSAPVMALYVLISAIVAVRFTSASRRR